MTTALALTKALKVNACGRILEISPDASNAITLLRRELVQKLRVSNPASLQLTDLAGKLIQSDDDLNEAIREGKLPLQAKLTVAALHEIEQKKRENRGKEQDMVGLQWQIVIEQVAAFSNELASVGAHIQSVHDDSRKIVQQFEEAEAMRREQLMEAIRSEAMEREASHRDILAKIEEISHVVAEEQSTREINYYQLGKQVEQVTSELNSYEQKQKHETAELERRASLMRHDMELAMQKNSENWNRSLEMLKRLDLADKDQTQANQLQHQRLITVEAESKKMRQDVDQLDIMMTKQMRDTTNQLKRQGEELERVARDTQFGREHGLRLVTNDHETYSQALERQILQIREEGVKQQKDAEERTKLIELRCANLEKEHFDRWDAQASRDHTMNEKFHKTDLGADSVAKEQVASEALLRTTITKVDELMDRMRFSEMAMHTKVETDHWKLQTETLAQMIQKQEQKMLQMEREFNMRITQEIAMREDSQNKLHGTVKSCFEKVGTPVKAVQDKDLSRPETNRTCRSENPRMEGSFEANAVNYATVMAAEESAPKEYAAPARELVREAEERRSQIVALARDHSRDTLVRSVSPARRQQVPLSPSVFQGGVSANIPVSAVPPPQAVARVPVTGISTSPAHFQFGSVRSVSPSSSRGGGPGSIGRIP